MIKDVRGGVSAALEDGRMSKRNEKGNGMNFAMDRSNCGAACGTQYTRGTDVLELCAQIVAAPGRSATFDDGHEMPI